MKNNEQFVNRPLIMLVGIIVLFMVAMMFVGCSEEKVQLQPTPKYTDLKPDIVGRLGQSLRQICYWENGDDAWVQTEFTSDKLIMTYVKNRDLQTIYDFNDNDDCIMVTSMFTARNSNDATLYVETIQETIKAIGFIVNEPLEKEDGTDVLIGTYKFFNNNSISGLMMVVRVKNTIKIGFSTYRETKST